jgi:hypothetical protein
MEFNNELYNSLGELNSARNLVLGGQIVKELGIKPNIPFEKEICIETKRRMRKHRFLFWTWETEGLVDRYSLRIKSNGKVLKVDKVYEDLTDYGLSCYAEIACEEECERVLDIKLKLL